MKRSKKSMTKSGDAVNVDRISDLPEALIVKILCLIPTKEAIATSVLSKRWKSHWKMMPILGFGYFFNIHNLDIKTICKSLLSHKAPVLECLDLQITVDTISEDDIELLIGIALSHKALKLGLEIYFHNGSFTFPSCLYKCETLETLKLKVTACMDVPSWLCFKSLRTLHLDRVYFKDDESVCNLLSGCPNLEDFVVRRNTHCTVKTFTIAVPSLQRLSICYDIGVEQQQTWGYVINAPSLKYFKIEEGVKPLEYSVLIENVPELEASCLIENVPELEEASLVNVSEIMDEKLLGSLTPVKRLSLALNGTHNIKLPTGSIFYRLVYLELFTHKPVWLHSLTLMLDASPMLQVLKLIERKSWCSCLYYNEEWNEQRMFLNVCCFVLRHSFGEATNVGKKKI